MLELFQAEWCPSSRRVRQRLTELGVDYVIRQVPVEPEERAALSGGTGSHTIPVLRLENGSVVRGAENILVFLAEQFVEPVAADEHREKAATMRRRYLDEECECSEPAARESS